MEIVDICREAGVPPGVVNLLSGDPAGVSEALIKSDIVKNIDYWIYKSWKAYFKASC